jgi:hypothetical protein
MHAIRTSIALATVLLIAVQPALAPCECTGCHAGCAAPSPTRKLSGHSPARPCCSHSKNSRMACCGSRGGECPCSIAKATLPRPGNGNLGTGCLCSAQSHPQAISAHVVAVDHAPVVDQWIGADASLRPRDIGSAQRVVFLTDRGPPERFGHLRLHAFLGVWII